MPFSVKISASCDKGLVRSNNEDMIAFSGTFIRDDCTDSEFEIGSNDKFFVAVADGMGGHNGGEVASEMVVRDLDRFVATLPSGLSFDLLKMAFDRWIQQIHNQVVQQGLTNALTTNMGTTLVGMLFYEDMACYINAGDSRLYRFRQNILRKISTDHSMRELGGVKNAPSNMLVNSIGGGKNTFLDFENITTRVLTNDVYLLCSDGLSDLAEDDVIEELLAKNLSVNDLVEKAKENGGTDNISAVLVTLKKNT